MALTIPKMLAARRPGAGKAGPALAGLLAVAGAAHFLIPQFYDAVIPRAMPGSHRMWVLASGGAELACAAAVANPSTRRLGATLAAVLFVLVFPANVQMAIDWSRQGPLRAAIGIGRLPVQIPLVYWALKVRRMAALPAT